MFPNFAHGGLCLPVWDTRAHFCRFLNDKGLSIAAITPPSRFYLVSSYRIESGFLQKLHNRVGFSFEPLKVFRNCIIGLGTLSGVPRVGFGLRHVALNGSYARLDSRRLCCAENFAHRRCGVVFEKLLDELHARCSVGASG